MAWQQHACFAPPEIEAVAVFPLRSWLHDEPDAEQVSYQLASFCNLQDRASNDQYDTPAMC